MYGVLKRFFIFSSSLSARFLVVVLLFLIFKEKNHYTAAPQRSRYHMIISWYHMILPFAEKWKARSKKNLFIGMEPSICLVVLRVRCACVCVWVSVCVCVFAECAHILKMCSICVWCDERCMSPPHILVLIFSNL